MMPPAQAATSSRIGIWVVVLALAAGLCYEVAALAELTGVFQPSPRSLFCILAPSLVLALTFPVLFSLLLDFVLEERRIWIRMGHNFIMMYSVINSIVYFTQLTIVIPKMLDGESSDVNILLFESGKFLYNLNGMAYGFMSLGTLIASFGFFYTRVMIRIRSIAKRTAGSSGRCWPTGYWRLG